jgi:hypothetical protein
MVSVRSLAALLSCAYIISRVLALPKNRGKTCNRNSQTHSFPTYSSWWGINLKRTLKPLGIWCLSRPRFPLLILYVCLPLLPRLVSCQYLHLSSHPQGSATTIQPGGAQRGCESVSPHPPLLGKTWRHKHIRERAIQLHNRKETSNSLFSL